MANYTLTITGELDPADRDLVRDLVGALTPKPERATSPRPAKRPDEPFAVSPKGALMDLRRRVSNTLDLPRVVAAQREIAEVAGDGYVLVVLDAISAAGWRHDEPTEEAGRLVLAYLDAALDSYPLRPRVADLAGPPTDLY